MKRLLLPFIIVGFLFSCGENERSVTIPPNVLSQQKMTRVITDIHLAEAEMNLNTLPDSTSKMPVGFQEVFDKDSITKQQYEESLIFYIDHPDMLDSIYTQVLNEMSKMQAGTK